MCVCVNILLIANHMVTILNKIHMPQGTFYSYDVQKEANLSLMAEIKRAVVGNMKVGREI